jgi:hypothetical protein
MQVAFDPMAAPFDSPAPIQNIQPSTEPQPEVKEEPQKTKLAFCEMFDDDEDGEDNDESDYDDRDSFGSQNLDVSRGGISMNLGQKQPEGVGSQNVDKPMQDQPS